MDLQRYLLIGAVGVLSYMLLIEWGQFQKEQQAITNAAHPIEQMAPAAEALPSQPAFEPMAPKQEHSDLPTETANTAPAQEIVKTPEVDQIRVSTDALELGINPYGGDINFVALPKHYAAIDTPDIPFVLLEQSQRREYIAMSGLIGKDGTDTSAGRPRFSSAEQKYSMTDNEDTLNVDLIAEPKPGVKLTKRFSFERGEYLVRVSYLIDNQSSENFSVGMFGQIKRDNSADPGSEGGGMGMAPYLGTAVFTADEPYKKMDFEDIREKPYRDTLQGGWIAMIQHYFLSAWIPDANQEHLFITQAARNGSNIIRFSSPAVTVAPGEQQELSAQFYAGPKDQYRLEEISPGLELSVDYGWLWWIAQPLFWVLTMIHKLVGNWGFAIIGITILVKAVFFQLNAKAYTSMANMRKVQPKLLALREQYADDKQKQSQEMMKLYQKEKINPLGGCLPILVQMPVFLALYWVLMESVELRHAPFILWIDDLSAMDPYFILPLLMGASMWVQQKLNPPPPDPMQAKIMQWMPVVFTFFFLFFPSGLVLYWVVNNVLSIAQQYVITKRIEEAP